MTIPVATPRHEKLDERAALIAHHWESAGELLRAARWRTRAAEWAGVHHPSAALTHWRKVRELTAMLPMSAETLELALPAHVWILELGWRVGIPDEEADAVFGEGKELAARAGQLAARAFLLLAFSAVTGMRGEMPRMTALAREAVDLGDRADAVEARLGARAALAYSLYFEGRLEESRAVTDQAIAITGADPSIAVSLDIPSALAFFTQWRGSVLRLLGDLDEAEDAVVRALAIAAEQGAIEVECWAHGSYGVTAMARGDRRLAMEHAQRSLEIAERTASGYSLVQAGTQFGRVLVAAHETEPAIDVLQAALAVARERRTALEWEAEAMAQLALAYAARGDRRALPAAQNAARLARERGLRLLGIVCGVALGRALALEGRYDEGAKALDAAHTLSRQARALLLELDVRLGRADLAAASGDAAVERRELMAARQIAVRTGAVITSSR